MALFAASVVTNVGDGRSTLFWTDRWLQGESIVDLAPTLMPFVRKRGWRSLTVHDALHQDCRTQFICGGLSAVAVLQYFQVWVTVHSIVLHPEESDHDIWTPSSSGVFSTKMAYQHFFGPAISFEPYHRLWRSWAPLKVKMFIWLAIVNRCWTADRLAHRGMDHPERCVLCDQEEESIQHILIT